MTDQITLHMTRAEIGYYLGMTPESVSRALSRLARCDVIHLGMRMSRRPFSMKWEALTSLIQHPMAPMEAAAIH